jgi:hypothetical protein
VTYLGVSEFAPAAVLLAVALRGFLPARHPIAVLLVVIGCIVGATTAEQAWTRTAWAILGILTCVTWVATGPRPGRRSAAARTGPGPRS